MHPLKSKFTLGQSVWATMNEQDFCAKIIAITFRKTGVTYDLHNDDFPFPDSYITIPEAGLRKEYPHGD